MKEFDLIVIGGGPGGYTAAIRAAQLDLKVALAEKANLGGTCLNWGCIPTKSLLHSADVVREIRNATNFGITTGPVNINLKKMVSASRDAASALSQGVAGLMRKNNIEVITGSAEIQEPGLVTVGGTEVLADNVLIATGARANTLPGIEPDGVLIWTAANAMTPKALPKRLLVIGAGAIGVEFASFYNTIGSKVTLVEVMDQILPAEDHEIAAAARASFEQEGIEVITSAELGDIKKGKLLSAVINGSKRNFDAAILSVGVTGVVDGLGLENTSASIDRTFIQVDENQRAAPGIYAIGDVAGPPCLAHKASHEGVIAAEVMAGLAPHPLQKIRIPGCTYSHPQVASVGLNEQSLGDRNVKIGRYPFYANGKAVATGATEGMIKTIFDEASGELLGAHMVGEGVSEMIQGFTLAMQMETTEQEIIETVFPHPTISESMQQAVMMAYGRALNL
jgi:dihydrolipoamide dehydrogenase